MQFAPFTLQVPDWHTAAAVEAQPPVGTLPFAVPHLLLSHTLPAHSFAFVHAVLSGPPQVPVTVLHVSETHTATWFVAVHGPMPLPSCATVKLVDPVAPRRWSSPLYTALIVYVPGMSVTLLSAPAPATTAIGAPSFTLSICHWSEPVEALGPSVAVNVVPTP
jgi:hypothetical protein